MASVVYPNYSRRIEVWNSANTAKLTSITVNGTSYNIGVNGNISMFCVNAGYGYGAEGGCTAGYLRLIGCLPDGSNSCDLTNPFFLPDNICIRFYLEDASTLPVWTGIVTSSRRQIDAGPDAYIHEYLLNGLFNRLIGYPSTLTVGDGLQETIALGVNADNYTSLPENCRYNHYYYPVGAGDGEDSIVNWLYNNVISGIEGIAGSSINYSGQKLGNDYKIGSWLLSYDQDVSNVLQDLSRYNYDYLAAENAEDLFPKPANWGVNNIGEFYYGYRPDTCLLTIESYSNPLNPNNKPRIYIGNSELYYESLSEETGSDFYNTLFLQGLNCKGLYQADYFGAGVRVRMDSQVLKGVDDIDQLAVFAKGYFARYGSPKANIQIDGIAISDASQICYPWLGYCRIINRSLPNGDEPAGRLDVYGVDIQFDETPIMSIKINGEFSSGSGRNGSPRWPGSCQKGTDNKIPREASTAPQSGSVVWNSEAIWLHAVGLDPSSY